MALGRVLACFLLLSFSIRAEEDRSRWYAPVIGATDVMVAMASMVDESTHMQRQSEIAAFLVIDPSGRYELIRWPSSQRSRRQSFTGVIPSNAIGIVHTHPNEWSRPSAGDRREAQRTGLPIFVITRWDVWVAEPDGNILQLVENIDWRDGLDPENANRIPESAE